MASQTILLCARFARLSTICTAPDGVLDYRHGIESRCLTLCRFTWRCPESRQGSTPKLSPTTANELCYVSAAAFSLPACLSHRHHLRTQHKPCIVPQVHILVVEVERHSGFPSTRGSTKVAGVNPNCTRSGPTALAKICWCRSLVPGPVLN